MIIKISNLGEGDHNFIFDENSKEVGLPEPFENGVHLEVNLRKSHSQVIIDNDLSLVCKFECDRCATEYVTNLNTKYQIVYMFGEEPVESEAINVVYLPIETDKIDLKPELRDYALLTIPMKKLCKEDCKGLCYRCGKNLNEEQCDCLNNSIDERWQPLAELKNKLNIK